MTSTTSTVSALPPLKITCTSTDCNNGLHCYIQKKGANAASGPCRSCGTNLVDWDRVHTRDLADVAHTFAALKTERIRHHFWHVAIDNVALAHARRKGQAGMQEAAVKRLRQSIGPAQPWRDGAQTPKQGNALFYAQHATATCCRKCVEEWHGIPRGRELTGEEITYLATLVHMYVAERLPSLTEHGEKIPTQRERLVSAERQKRQPPASESSHPLSGGHEALASKPPRPPAPQQDKPSSSQRLLAAVARRQQRGEHDD